MTKKTDQELTELVATTRLALREGRFAAAGARAKDPSAAGKLRKVVARALTQMREREIKAL